MREGGKILRQLEISLLNIFTKLCTFEKQGIQFYSS